MLIAVQHANYPDWPGTVDLSQGVKFSGPHVMMLWVDWEKESERMPQHGWIRTSVLRQAATTPPGGRVRYWVRAIREQADGSIVSYRADTEAATSGDAAVALGDKIRANDLDGVTVTGPHQPVLQGQQADIIAVDVRRLG